MTFDDEDDIESTGVASIENMIAAVAESIRPSERVSVAESARRHRIIDGKKWDREIAPYVEEPMEVMSAHKQQGVILVAPARTGKSELALNLLQHCVEYDPGDMTIFDMTQAVARDWSNKELKRFLRSNTSTGKKVLVKNVHDLSFRNGMQAEFKWPTITELSGKTLQRVWLRDYDRMPIDIDGEGNPFDLAKKRTTTFGRFALAVAEASPGHEIENPAWTPRTPHEAPPTKGILELYNRGDRRRWYWRCINPRCRHSFEPRFKYFNYPNSADDMEAAAMVTLRCPHCAFDIEPHFKRELNIGGKWIKEGQHWAEDGKVYGEPIRSDIASFWMFGPAAAFQKWESLVLDYLRAERAYKTTGDIGPLKKTITADQGEAFLSPSLAEGRLPDWLAERKEHWGSKETRTVPFGVRFLVATIDVQAGTRSGFVVQIHGFGEGGDVWLVDYFRILKSDRLDADGERLPLDPAGYAEDWHLLVDQVIERTYPLDDGSGRRMQIKAVGCDAGGKAGVATNAINFWRWLRDTQGNQHHNRFRLILGRTHVGLPRWQISYVDSNRKDRNSGARGDVPFLILNSNLLKDQLYAKLGRTDPGGGMYHFADWTDAFIFNQMTTEVRTTKGWDKPNKQAHNEAWDLAYYSEGLALTSLIDIERIKWDRPPNWAAEWDKNDLVTAAGIEGFVVKKPTKVSLAELARKFS